MSDPQFATPPVSQTKTQSFLHEAQKFGKASEKVQIDDLDTAIGNVCHILKKEEAERFRNLKEDQWDTVILKLYCHDCRAIVSAGIGSTPKGKPRTVCGTCGSKKISSGREEALVQFYHLNN